MNTTLTLVLILTPLLGFLLNIFLGKSLGKSVSGVLGTLAVAVSFAVSVMFFLQISETKQPITICLFDWIQISNIKINFSFLLDQLSVLWLLFVYRLWLSAKTRSRQRITTTVVFNAKPRAILKAPSRITRKRFP